MEYSENITEGEWMDGGEHQIDKSRIPKNDITVTEPAWVGSALTGNRTCSI